MKGLKIMYGYIYLTENLINHKKYIGQHKSEEWDDKYIGSGKIISQSIQKYGFENFTCSLLQECDSEDSLNDAEYYWINKYDAVNSSEFYNLVAGGNHRSIVGQIYINDGYVEKKIFEEELQSYLDNGWYKGRLPRSETAIKKTADANRGKKRTLEQRLKISNSLKGISPSDEARKKMSEAKKGISTSRKGKICVYLPPNGKNTYINKEDLDKYISMGYIKGDNKKGKPLSKEHCESLSKAHTGKKHGSPSEETRRKISEAQKGRVFSDETRKKMSEARKGKIPWNKGIKMNYHK